MPNSRFAELALPTSSLGGMEWRQKRHLSIEEACGFRSGPSQSERQFTALYAVDDYQVGVLKPGKEAAPDYPKRNMNDMLPAIIRHGARVEYEPTFGGIWKQFAVMHVEQPEALSLLGCLLVRSAFMLDHIVDGSTVRYRPPGEVFEHVSHSVPSMYIKDTSGKPHVLGFDVFLYLMEVLALNEDVKYHTLGHKPGPVGRRNNLLTCANVIGVCVDKINWMDFAYSLMRGRGVAPITQSLAKEIFFADYAD